MGKSVNIDLDEDEGRNATETVVDADAPVALDAGPADVVDEDAGDPDRLPTNAISNADGSVTLPLLYPRELQIRKDGKVRTDRYEQLTFHRLNGADQRAIAATSEAMMGVVAFSRSTRISQAIMNALFDKMDAADITASGRVLNSFLASGPRTGR